jgi:hypothetical protein
MDQLAEVMMWRENSKIEQEYKRDQMEKEKQEREVKELEAEKSKKEREDFRREMKEQQETFLNKFGNNTTAGSVVQKRRRKDAADDEDEETHPTGGEDYKALLRKPKKQAVNAPIDADAWVDWTCSKKMAASLVKRFPGKCAGGDFEGNGLLDIAETLETKLGSSKEILAARYLKEVGKESRARWSRVDLLVGLVAHFCDGDGW